MGLSGCHPCTGPRLHLGRARISACSAVRCAVPVSGWWLGANLAPGQLTSAEWAVAWPANPFPLLILLAGNGATRFCKALPPDCPGEVAWDTGKLPKEFVRHPHSGTEWGAAGGWWGSVGGHFRGGGIEIGCDTTVGARGLWWWCGRHSRSRGRGLRVGSRPLF